MGAISIISVGSTRVKPQKEMTFNLHVSTTFDIVGFVCFGIIFLNSCVVPNYWGGIFNSFFNMKRGRGRGRIPQEMLLRFSSSLLALLSSSLLLFLLSSPLRFSVLCSSVSRLLASSFLLFFSSSPILVYSLERASRSIC